jgi:TIR domain
MGTQMEPLKPAGSRSKLNVFLSYRSVEARFADVLKEHLVRDFIGLVDVFLASDTTSVPAGSRWLAEILEALQVSNLHVVICSHYSVRRPWINYEAGAAGVRSVPIVPLCHSGLLPDQLPVPLSESEGGLITDPIALRKVYEGRVRLDSHVVAWKWRESDRPVPLTRSDH